MTREDDLKSNIDQYCSYFTDKLDEVCAIENILFKKILLVTMLDTLARAPASTKKRFIGFIDKFTDWQDKDRISLPQLSFLLEREHCSQLKMQLTEDFKAGKPEMRFPFRTILNVMRF